MADLPSINVAATETEATAELVRQQAQPVIMHVQDPMRATVIPVLAIPRGMVTVDVIPALEARMPHPSRRRGTIKAESLAALIDLVNRQKTEGTVIYVSENGGKPNIVAVINDHFDADGAPGHRDFRVEYAPEVSGEWETWTEAEGKPMGQATFASFLEDHLLDLADPSVMGERTKAIVEALGVTVAGPAALRGLARDFSVRAKSQIRDAVNLQSGETQIVFATAHETDAGQPVTVPGAFLIQIPVFHLGAPFVFVARLRYRIEQGIAWHYRLSNTDRAMRAALDDMITALREKCGPTVLVLEGKP